MGKTRLADRIAAELPEHTIYVEPFAGGAQVLFCKKPSEVEVVSDLDPEIAFAFKFAKNLTAEQLERLRRKKWVGDKEHFKKLVDAGVPEDDLERFYRFAYLSRFSFNKLRRGTLPEVNVGADSHFIAKLERHAPRLSKVKVRCADYEKVIDEFDGPNTVFFLDPPYTGYNADRTSGTEHKDWDEERFATVLRRIKGKFLCTYGTRGSADLFKGFTVRRWRHTSGVGTSQGNGPRQGVTLVATNYKPQATGRKTKVSSQSPVSSLTKTIWGSPAGKKRLAERLASLLPAHDTYVEPFAGSAAVLFAKEPAKVEVLNDADPEIGKAYQVIKQLSSAELARLRTMVWTGDKTTFTRIFDSKPTGKLEKLHRFLYVAHFSYGKLRSRSFSPASDGAEATTVDRLEKFSPRLKHVRIHSGDYEKVVRKYDGKATVFYLDPPYPGYNVDVGESDFDEERFLKVLKALKGKFLLTYGTRGTLPGRFEKEGFKVKRIRPSRTIGSMRGVGGPKVLTTLLVSNYDLVEKNLQDALGDEWTLEDLEKRQPFGTFGGSFHYAKRIVPLIPEHTTYVEPFAGAAAVLHAKEPSHKEVLADLDDDVVFLHRFIKGMNTTTLAKLQKLNWTCTLTNWKRVRALQPANEVERFYKLAFIRGKGRDARPDATHPAGSALGQTTHPEKYLEAAQRLLHVTILKQDFRKTISQFDGKQTFFFLDPPYPGEWYDKDAAVDVDEFLQTLATIRGRFIAVLNDSPQNAAAFKRVGHIFRLKVREASGTGGAKTASRLFCSNYKIAKTEDCEILEDRDDLDKEVWSRAFLNDLPDSAFLYIEVGGEKDEDGKTVPRSLRHFPVRDAEGGIDLPHLRNAIARIPQAKIPGLSAKEKIQSQARQLLAEATKKNLFDKAMPLLKGADPTDERFVLGIVLEPEVVDAQGDIYSEPEVRQAAHRFMEDFGGLGLMHRLRVNGQVKVLESFLAPVDFVLSNQAVSGQPKEETLEPHSPQLKADAPTVRRGTWLLAVRILDDDLWKQVKDGTLSGFSIGGSARRVPAPEPRVVSEENTVQKAQSLPQDSGPTAQDSPTHRLHDIVVEEVSLVDRAANKHKFLIVKRSDVMDEHTDLHEQGSEQPSTDSQSTATGGVLEVAVEALERLTDAVEALEQAPEQEQALDGLIGELHTLTDRLTETAGGGAKPKPEANPLEAVRTTLGEVVQLLERQGKPAVPPQENPLQQELTTLAGAVKELVSGLKDQAQRLSKLEKNVGLPNSTPATEKNSEEIGWPLDLNRPCDRESVDKAVSFHEL